MGVFIMEPFLGGKLTGKTPSEVQDIWDKASVKRTPAEWALRWVMNHPGVICVLSGMNQEEHIKENLHISEEGLPNSLTEKELGLVGEVRDK
ncbi:MAG: aldo/keto reductase, partial [Methanobacterium sp.]